ncbi:PREDICTED: uncharacterized protein LOC108969610 [Bactrocera latifrons]|uniref:Uncharacterized protein n=1 Tax=Bactrocera latifrons TaxID=174628 RepID=A0A0K8TVS9_BACLA|nr:PREDICTED: uncharacterized protein LOC108969610 [Bactrocera latifrons]
MSSRKISLLLLVAYSIALIHARPNEKLAARLSRLYLDPANDERFNDIERFNGDEVQYSARKDMVDEEVVLQIMDVSTKKNDEIEALNQSAEIEEGLTRSMVSSIFRFMANVMGPFIHRL